MAMNNTQNSHIKSELVEDSRTVWVSNEPRDIQIAFKDVTFSYTPNDEVQLDEKTFRPRFFRRRLCGDRDKRIRIDIVGSLDERNVSDCQNTYDASNNRAVSDHLDDRRSKVLFEHLSFQIKKHEFVSIIGPSGCGKSSIFRLLNGLESAQHGTVEIDGTAIHTSSVAKCAFMPQKDLLLPWRTAQQNVELPLELQGVPDQERQERSAAILETVGLMDYGHKKPSELSGGMRQRVSFARTLVTGKDILLLDEPFSALDALTKMQLQTWLIEQCIHLPKTVVLVTHDIDEALYLSDCVLVMIPDPKTKVVTALKTYDLPHSRPRQRSTLSSSDMQQIKLKMINDLYLSEELS